MLHFAWIPFFIAPFLWADIFFAVTAADILYFSTALFAAAFMWNPTQQNLKHSTHPASWLFIMLCITPLLIHLLLNDLRSPWHAWRQILYLTAAWLVFQMARDKAQKLLEQRAFMYLLGSIAMLYIAYALIQAYDIRFFAKESLFPFWSTSGASRFSGPLMQPNFQGAFLAITTIALLFYINKQKQAEITLFTLSTIACTGLLLTSGRTSFLTFLLGALLLYWASHNRKQCLHRLVLCFSISIGISLIIQQSIPSLASLSVTDRFEAGGYMTRILIWDLCWQLYQQHAIIGIGWGNLAAHWHDGLIITYQTHPGLQQTLLGGGGLVWAHNIILQFMVEGGLFGLFAILLLIASIGLKVSSKDIPSGSMLGGVLAIMLLAHGMLSVSMMQPFFFMLLALFVAALFPNKLIKHE